MASREGGCRVPHAGVRQDHGGISGAPRHGGETREGGGAPDIRRLVGPDAGMRAPGCRGWARPQRLTIIRGTSGRSAGIDQGPGGGPHPHNTTHRGATGRTMGHERLRGRALGRRGIAGVGRHDQAADGRERKGTAGMAKAEVADFLQAIRQAMLEEPAEQRDAVEVGGAQAGTAHFPVGARHGTIREADETVVGDGHREDIRGEVLQGGVTMVVGLTVDMPGDGPDLRVDVLQQAGLAHLFLAKRTGHGGERFDRDEAVGSGRTPGCAVPGEATARDDGVDVRVVLELSTPGMQDTSQSREVGPDEALVFRQPCEGRCRRLQQGLVREAVMRADEGPERLRDRQGAEEVRPRELVVQVVREPLGGCMLLTLGTVAVATGMLDAMVPSTVLARREAVAVVAVLTVLDGAEDLAVCGGEVGRALQVLWGKRRADLAEGRHGRSLPS